MARGSARTGAALVAALLTGTSLAGCTGSPSEPAGSAATVPVLWVANSDGSLTGGVSTASVDARLTGGTGDYSVEVEGAGGADTGDSWNAAAAMASAVGVLYSGQDPRGVQVSFAVSDSIDGSSAGGVLTVGVIAAMRDLAIDPKVAMTGTIGPDGSIGHVDGVEAKVRAAAASGFTTVLVPAASVDASGQGPTASADPSSDPSATPSGDPSAEPSAQPSADATEDGLDPTSLASELGITVTAISTVDQAVEAFTGTAVAPSGTTAPPLAEAAASAMSGQVDSVLGAVEDGLVEHSAQLRPKVRAALAADLARARELADTGDDASAYALGLGSLLVLDQAVAAREAKAAISADGSPQVMSDVTEAAAALVAEAERLLQEQSSASVSQDPVRRYATVSAMTWLTRSIAVLRAVSAELEATGGTVSSQVVEAARVVAQYALAVQRIYPDSLQIAELLDATPDADPVDVTSFVDAYTSLLASAGAANQAYYEGVLTSIAANPDLTFSQPGHTYASVQQLQQVVTPDSTTDPTASASDGESGPSSASPSGSTSRADGPSGPDVDCAWAMSYFLLTAALVADEQEYDLTGSTIGSLDVTAGRPAALTAALGSSADTVAAFTAQLSGQGVDMDHPVWTGSWAAALAQAFDGRSQETAARVIGLSVTWDAAVEAFMNTAALSASQRPATGPEPESASVVASSGTPTASASGSNEAQVRGTSVTLTNATSGAVEVKPATYNGGEGSYSSLAAGASLSESDPDTNQNSVTFYFKTSDGGIAAVMFSNPAISYPYVRLCGSTSATGCASDDDFLRKWNFSEGEQQELALQNDAGQTMLAVTATRGSDTDDYKNWTASLTQLG